MSTKVKTDRVESVTMYVTGDLCVGRQYSFWYETAANFVLVPASWYGMVAVAPSDVPVGTSKPLYGCLVYRPRALELTFLPGVRVKVVQTDRLVMQDWCRETLPWAAVKFTSR